MEFAERLARLRKERGLTQQELAEGIDLHVSQLRRYEYGTSQPTLEVLRKLAVVLGVSADTLIFADDEREMDVDLKTLLEAIEKLGDEEKRMVKTFLNALLLHHQAKRWTKAG